MWRMLNSMIFKELVQLLKLSDVYDDKNEYNDFKDYFSVEVFSTSRCDKIDAYDNVNDFIKRNIDNNAECNILEFNIFAKRKKIEIVIQ